MTLRYWGRFNTSPYVGGRGRWQYNAQPVALHSERVGRQPRPEGRHGSHRRGPHLRRGRAVERARLPAPVPERRAVPGRRLQLPVLHAQQDDDAVGCSCGTRGASATGRRSISASATSGITSSCRRSRSRPGASTRRATSRPPRCSRGTTGRRAWGCPAPGQEQPDRGQGDLRLVQLRHPGQLRRHLQPQRRQHDHLPVERPQRQPRLRRRRVRHVRELDRGVVVGHEPGPQAAEDARSHGVGRTADSRRTSRAGSATSTGGKSIATRTSTSCGRTSAYSIPIPNTDPGPDGVARHRRTTAGP